MRWLIRTINKLGESIDLFWLLYDLGMSVILRVVGLVVHLLIVLALTVGSFWIPDIPLHLIAPKFFEASTIFPTPRLLIAAMALVIGMTSLVRDLREFLRDLLERQRDESLVPTDHFRRDDVVQGPDDRFMF